MPKKVPAVFMRGGAGRGIFFHERDIPAPGPERDHIFLSVLGSPDPFGRQLNGMGGGNSSLSKVVIVRTAADTEVDVEYLHGQVSLSSAIVDYSANCGNLSGAVGPFAVSEGLVALKEGITVVRMRNLNTGDIVHAHVPVEHGDYPNSGRYAIPGVGGANAKVALEYLMPGGGCILATNSARETISGVDVTLGLSPLATVWTHGPQINFPTSLSPQEIDSDLRIMSSLDHLRRLGAVRMRLADSLTNANLASPKIGIVSPPTDYVALDGKSISADDFDISARVLSMEMVHKSIPLACAMNLAAATCIEGSVPFEMAKRSAPGEFRIGTPSGVLNIRVVVKPNATGFPYLARVGVDTSARRLMEGYVFYDPAETSA
ncbi:conserved hypothetical protein (plasmid) [Novosphingobium sp. PP1Y]|nr:conserved hypothetical protein [Novosphingobium sp. PP1Y]